jgi:lipopolysaccharide heptosyltransferase I
MPAEPSRIALVKLSAIGDVVHALPVAAALRAGLPGARLTWIVERREAAVLRGHPALDEVVEVDTRAWRRARRPAAVRAAVADVRALRDRLRAARLDVAIDLQGLLKSGLITAATRAPLRLGFAARRLREPLSALFTNRRVAPPARARHVVEQYLALLEPLGIAQPKVEFALPWSAEAEARVDAFFAASDLRPRQRVVVLSPGAGRPRKRWPVARFAELAERLAREAYARVLVVWGPGERADAAAIAAEARSRRVLLAPPTDLDELIAVLRRASVMVAADTGPLHLAAALGIPCVGLYGPTSPERNGPYGGGHRVVRAADGTLGGIGVAAVLTAVQEVLT